MQRSGIVNRIFEWRANALIYIAERDGWNVVGDCPMINASKNETVRYAQNLRLERTRYNKYGAFIDIIPLTDVYSFKTKKFIEKEWKK